MTIISPTIGFAVRTEGTGVRTASGEMSQIDTRRDCALSDGDGSGGIGSGIIAELTRTANSPTISFIIRAEGAGVRVSS